MKETNQQIATKLNIQLEDIIEFEGHRYYYNDDKTKLIKID